jgi:endonuclease/exonuclease/phosphatase family metal-dependent hydrolase
MRVVTYNIHKGFSFGNRQFVLADMRHALHNLNADVVLLQEVQGEHRRKARIVSNWPNSEQHVFLADGHFDYKVYGRTWDGFDGHHGNAVLSRYPIIYSNNIDISNVFFQKRSLLHVIVLVSPERPPVHFICLHFDLHEKGRLSQVNRLIERIEQAVPHHTPLVIAGDFNDWRGIISQHLEDGCGVEEVYKRTHGRYARSFPSRFPLLPLDRVYVRGLDCKAASCLTGDPWVRLSDHVPLVADFTFREALTSSGPVQ